MLFEQSLEMGQDGECVSRRTGFYLCLKSVSVKDLGVSLWKHIAGDFGEQIKAELLGMMGMGVLFERVEKRLNLRMSAIRKTGLSSKGDCLFDRNDKRRHCCNWFDKIIRKALKRQRK